MFREKIPTLQLSAWLFVAMVPPLVQLACGASWVWFLVLAVLSVFLFWLRGRIGCVEIKNWMKAAGGLLTVLVIGKLSILSVGAWPTGDGNVAVPLILLALGAWSASKGPLSAARVGAVLFFFIIIVYMFLFTAGVGQIRMEWLLPTKRIPEESCLVVLLLPLAALPVQGRTGGRLITGLIVVLGGILLTQGVLSPAVAERIENPFYEMSQSLELLGIARRFEAVVSAASTVGWFAVAAYLLSVVYELWGRLGVWAGALGSAVLSLCGMNISCWLLAGAWAVFWVGLPLIAQGIEKIKKS